LSFTCFYILICTIYNIKAKYQPKELNILQNKLLVNICIIIITDSSTWILKMLNVKMSLTHKYLELLTIHLSLLRDMFFYRIIFTVQNV